MAHKKAAGSAKNLRDSKPKYRGVKLFGGQTARAGNIVIRQKGDKYLAGENAYKAKDFTIHASIDGVVQFRKKAVTRYDGRKYLKTVVDIIPSGEQPVAPKAPAKKSAPKAEKKVEEKVETPVEAPAAKTATTSDDLTKIKGLGAKAAEALEAAGITSYAGLVEAGVDGAKAALEKAGGRLASTDPTDWVKEAKSL